MTAPAITKPLAKFLKNIVFIVTPLSNTDIKIPWKKAKKSTPEIFPMDKKSKRHWRFVNKGLGCKPPQKL